MCEPLRQCAGVLPSRVEKIEHMCHDMCFKTDFGAIKAGFNIVADYREHLRAESAHATVLAEYGWQTALPVLVLNRFGKGRCITSGASFNRGTRFTSRMVRSLAAEAGIAPHVEVKGKGEIVDRDVFLGLRKRVGGHLLVMVEVGDRSRRVKVRLNAERLALPPRTHRLDDCLSGASLALGPETDWSFETDLSPADIKVYDLSSETAP